MLVELVGSCTSSEGFFLVLWFSSLYPNQHKFSNSNLTRKQWMKSHSMDLPLKFVYLLIFIYILKSLISLIGSIYTTGNWPNVGPLS